VILELMEMITISLKQNIVLNAVSIIINNKSQSIRKHKNSAMQILQLHLNYMKNKTGNGCNIHRQCFKI